MLDMISQTSPRQGISKAAFVSPGIFWFSVTPSMILNGSGPFHSYHSLTKANSGVFTLSLSSFWSVPELEANTQHLFISPTQLAYSIS